MYTLVVRTSRISDPGVEYTYVVVTPISDSISLFRGVGNVVNDLSERYLGHLGHTLGRV